MHFDEYGSKDNPIIVFLHGAHFVHSFGRQYPLSDKFYLSIPHIMGYGDDADRIFDTETAVSELAEFIGSYGKKVTLVGFSLGAQLAVKLIAERPELFSSAVIVSPWLIKDEKMLEWVLKENMKQFNAMKNKAFCNIIGMMNGMPAKQRKIFVGHMQNEREETVRNTVYNGITLDSVESFSAADFPIVALAGEREQDEVKESVKALSKMNPNCRYEIWKKAAHNIPPLFYKKFNELICNIVPNE